MTDLATIRLCSVDGCGKPHTARGFCVAHYTRYLRGQDLHAMSDRQRVAQTPVDEVIRLYLEEGWSTISIARHFNIADVTVSAMLKKNGVSIRKDYLTRPRIQSRSARAKLDEYLIVMTYKVISDISVYGLARIHNAAPTTVKTILLDHGVVLRPAKKVRHAGRWQRDPKITDEQRMRSRRSIITRQWRLAVFKRDHFECQSCGMFAERATLEAHHIENWSSAPEKRFTISNGITFCNDCHVRFHQRFGYRNNDREQLAMFIVPAMELAA